MFAFALSLCSAVFLIYIDKSVVFIQFWIVVWAKKDYADPADALKQWEK